MDIFETPLIWINHCITGSLRISHLCLHFLEYVIHVHVIIKVVLITVTVTILIQGRRYQYNIIITNKFHPYLVITLRKLCCSGS